MGGILLKVRDIIKGIEADGWYLVTTKGSHRQYKHPVKPGRITIAGYLADDLAPGTFEQYFQTSKKRGMMPMHRFLIVIKKAGKNYLAYSPDLP